MLLMHQKLSYFNLTISHKTYCNFIQDQANNENKYINAKIKKLFIFSFNFQAQFFFTPQIVQKEEKKITFPRTFFAEEISSLELIKQRYDCWILLVWLSFQKKQSKNTNKTLTWLKFHSYFFHRTTTVAITMKLTKTVYVDHLFCCPGWAQTGDVCSKRKSMFSWLNASDLF